MDDDVSGSGFVEIGENREDSTVTVVGQRQCREDAADVLSDRRLGYDEPLRDLRIRQPLGHQPQDFLLAWGECRENPPPARVADKCHYAIRVDDRCAGGDLANHAKEAADVCNAVLEQVAETATTGVGVAVQQLV